MYVTDLADVLRAGGVEVVEVPGWKTASHRPLAAVKGIVCHHTAGPRNATGTPSLGVVEHGRPDVSGPLCNIYLPASGVAYLVAAGRANHAGKSEFHGITDVGSNFLGIEAENAGDGTDIWEATQMDGYARICAVTGEHYGFDAAWVRGHKEVAIPRGRKIDPSFDMNGFRDTVENLMTGHPMPTAIPRTVDPRHDMLRKGASGASVRELQERLNIKANAGLKVDTFFGEQTRLAVIAYQTANGLTADGLVGPKTWALLLK